MSDRTAVFGSSRPRALSAIDELGLDRKRTIVLTSHGNSGDGRGCIIDRLILVDDAFPSDEVRESLHCSMQTDVKIPQVFRWRRSAL